MRGCGTIFHILIRNSGGSFGKSTKPASSAAGISRVVVLALCSAGVEEMPVTLPTALLLGPATLVTEVVKGYAAISMVLDSDGSGGVIALMEVDATAFEPRAVFVEEEEAEGSTFGFADMDLGADFVVAFLVDLDVTLDAGFAFVIFAVRTSMEP